MEELGPAERLAHGVAIDGDHGRLTGRRDSRRRFAKQRPKFALQLPDTGLARVVGDHKTQFRIVHRDFVDAQAIPLDLTRPQMPPCDRHLFVGRVAVEADDFHPV